MFITGRTDIGRFRDENQDRFRVSMLEGGAALAIVCDGMGGAASGGLASDMAAGAVYDRVMLSFRSDMEPKSIKAMLMSAVSAANALVYSKGSEEESNHGMGTTCVAAIIHNGILSVVNVGDSRAYLMSEKGITQITTDHTMEEFFRSKGVVEESQVKLHNMKNVITRAVGVDSEIEADYFELGISQGDSLLLCTDGLTNYLSDELIYSIVYKKPIETAANELIDRVNAKNGKDNITAVIASV